jgi:hypothetical protein
VWLSVHSTAGRRLGEGSPDPGIVVFVRILPCLLRQLALRGEALRRVAIGGRQAEALLLLRFDREWNTDASAYTRHGLVSGLTVLDAEDGNGGRERWSYLLLADELRRWSVKPREATTTCRSRCCRRSGGTWRAPLGAMADIDSMLAVVKGWREFFAGHKVESRSVEMLERAILPTSFFRTEPVEAI